MTQQNPEQNTNPNPNPEPPAPAPMQQTGGVQTLSNDGTMQTGNAGTAGAAGSSAEDTLKAYEGLIEQMRAQNETLIKANESLQSQIGLLIRGGGSVGQHTADPEPQNPTQEPGYTSFADLGKELGKRDYYSHNVKDGG